MSSAALSVNRLDPEDSRILEDSRERVRRRAAGRDLWSALLLATAFFGAAIAGVLLIDSARQASISTLVSLVLAYALASNVRFEVGAASVVPTQLVFVPLLFVLPLDWVMPAVVAGEALALLLSRSAHIGRALFLAPINAWYSAGPVVVLALLLETPRAPVLEYWPAFVLALAAQFAVNLAATVPRPCLVLGVSPRRLLPMVAQGSLVDAALAPVGFAVAFVAWFNPVAIVLVVPLVGLLAYFSRERRARIDHALELGKAYRGTAMLLGDVVEADDEYTGAHSKGVVDLVLAVADELHLKPRERQQAEFVALLHDVGKIRIPNEIINKPGPLTAEEREVIETHTVVGEQMLDKVGGMLGEVGRLVRSCHERWDGTGYPDRLAGEAIPLVSRIVCACDAYDAMTTDRPYRAARAPEEALAELRRCAGAQFDPIVVEAIARVVELDDVRAAAA